MLLKWLADNPQRGAMIAIAVLPGIPARTRFRTLVRRKSWCTGTTTINTCVISNSREAWEAQRKVTCRLGEWGDENRYPN